MQDRRDAKHVEDEIHLPVCDVMARGALAIRRHVVALRWDAEPAEIEAAQPAKLLRRESPCHDVIREIGKRMPQRRQLPIENRDDARLRWMEDDVIHAEVA